MTVARFARQTWQSWVTAHHTCVLQAVTGGKPTWFGVDVPFDLTTIAITVSGGGWDERMFLGWSMMVWLTTWVIGSTVAEKCGSST